MRQMLLPQSVWRRYTVLIFTMLLLGIWPPAAQAQINVSLTPSLPSGQAVGTTITWKAATAGSAALAYQFSVEPAGGTLRVVVDFGPRDYFTWTPIEEGSYIIQVAVKAPGASMPVNVLATYAVRSRLTDSRPVVFATPNPLVALYSAPPCTSGRMRVTFHLPRSTIWKSTDWKPCQPKKSMNFYVGGMRAATTYMLQHELDTSNSVQRGPVLEYQTGALRITTPSFKVLQPAGANSSLTDSVILQSVIMGEGVSGYPLATDFTGKLIWYYQPDRSLGYWGPSLMRPVSGGTMLIFLNDSLTSSVWAQVLREIDLAGGTVRETNIPRINEQLAASGKGPVLGFSHEAQRLPNGHTLVLANQERILTDVQDPGPTDVLGDMMIDLDENLQVVWSWSTFDHLDTKRAAPLGEQCSLLIIGCPPLQLATRANDWTHSNSISYLPADGNLLLSMRNQDWVIKIDYADGAGSGAVLWRLGRDGDFTIQSNDPYPWFTHQHDVEYEDGQLTVFDNGNTRCNSGRLGCNSRGQVLRIDEQARVATLELNANLGRYAEAFGSAQKLSNGNFHFTIGTQGTRLTGQSIETLPDGSKAYALQTNAVMYRSFRMQSLYMP